MHGDGLTVIIFLGALTGAGLSLYVNISLAKKKIGRWDSNSTALFVMSLGAFGKRQRETWQRTGYSEEEASTIIDYQLFSLMEMPLGFVASAILVVVMSL
jgi:hypothetical protein